MTKKTWNGFSFSYDLETDCPPTTSEEEKNFRIKENRKNAIPAFLIYGVLLVIYVLLNPHRHEFGYSVAYWAVPMPFVYAAYYAIVNDDPREIAGMKRPRFWLAMLANTILGFASWSIFGEVRQRVRQNRLVTLTGPGGTGKTRLALKVAEGLLEEFPAGVFLVELAPVSDPALLPQYVTNRRGRII